MGRDLNVEDRIGWLPGGLDMSDPAVPRLTQLSHGAGCGCKLPAADLSRVLQLLPKVTDPAVLVGHEWADDACVYRLNDEQAVVQTLDFFTPIVDDPYTFGSIAAANAISDIYAMGARPIFALNIVAFPMGTLGAEVLNAILRGGADKAREAGIFVIGGHSIDDAEPKYGMCVTGLVRPDRIMANNGAKVGDRLVLTKPLGVGVLATAVKRGLRTEAEIDHAIRCMAALNRPGAAAMEEVSASASTDITGFGLCGHLRGMAVASGVGMRLRFGALPVLAGVTELIEQDCAPGGSWRNREHYGQWVDFAPEITEAEQLLCCDAQTSGGLVVSVPRAKSDALVASLERHGALAAAVIGEVVAEHPGRLFVTR
jgi:selenide, water dikinase